MPEGTGRIPCGTAEITPPLQATPAASTHQSSTLSAPVIQTTKRPGTRRSPSLGHARKQGRHQTLCSLRHDVNGRRTLFPEVTLLVLSTFTPLVFFLPHALSSQARSRGYEGAGGVKPINRTETKLHWTHLACCVQLKVIVRDVRALHVTHTFTCVDLVNQLEWSADSLFLSCSMHRRAVVQVWSLEEPEWHCKINEGSAGLIHSCWSPDGRHILNTAEFHLRITVWSLCSKSVSYIRYPKNCAKGMDFTQDGQYMALAERRNCKDFVSVFACQDWQLLKHFATDTEDLAGLIWSPNGCVLCIWEASTEYKVLVYSADGRVLFTYSAYCWALGVKAVAWSPSSQFLAVGSYDEKVRVFCDITWQKIDELSHPKKVSDASDVVVYEEVEGGGLSGELGAAGASAGIKTSSKYEVVKIPFDVSVEEPDPDRANPRLGVGLIAFSSDGHYMATRNDNMRWAVWVWSVGLFRLISLLHHKRPVETLAWHPSQPRLAIACDGPSVFLWSPGGCVSVVVPSEGAFHMLGVKWQPDGKSFLVTNKTEFCLCYLEMEDTVQGV